MYKANQSMTKKVEEYLRLKGAAERLEREAEETGSRIKGYMDEKGLEQMLAGEHTVTCRTVSAVRLDTALIRKELGESVLAPFMKTVESKRLNVK